jgi:protein-tyrosine phosphatase
MSYRVALVCLGNICRSPIAEVVLRTRLEEAGLDGEVEVVSAGTGTWHIGEAMDRRAAAVLARHGYDGSDHRAQETGTAGLEEADLILAMDRDNHAELTRLLSPAARERLRMFRDFDPRAPRDADGMPTGDREVPDPYFGGEDGFDTVLGIVERTVAALVAELSEREVERS